MSPTTFRPDSAIAETLLVPLYCRAKESKRADGLIHDERSVALVDRINFDFSGVQLQGHDEIAVILRMRHFDQATTDFLGRNPQGVVVHIGCGLDTRFDRVDNGQVEWYDLDLPEVIDFRRQLIGGEAERYHLLATSVLEPAWLDAVSVHRDRPSLFLAEGVLTYFEEADVKSLLLTLKDRFPGCELVTDAMTPLVVRMDNFALRFTKIRARLHWGLKRAQDVEEWGEGIRLLGEWYYFDDPEPRLAHLRWARHIPALAKSTGVYHYRLGERVG
jgi:O-methyltransferase involved in polyketide biosynthesis